MGTNLYTLLKWDSGGNTWFIGMHVRSPMDVSYDILTEQNTAANRADNGKWGLRDIYVGYKKKAPWQPPKDLFDFYSLVSGFTLLLWVILDKKQCLFAL